MPRARSGRLKPNRPAGRQHSPPTIPVALLRGLVEATTQRKPEARRLLGFFFMLPQQMLQTVTFQRQNRGLSFTVQTDPRTVRSNISTCRTTQTLLQLLIPSPSASTSW